MGAKDIAVGLVLVVCVILFLYVRKALRKPAQQQSPPMELASWIPPVPPAEPVFSSEPEPEPMLESEIDFVALARELDQPDTTIERCWDIYHEVPYGHHLEQQAIAAVGQRIERKLQAAQTSQDCSDMYKDVPEEEASVGRKVLSRGLELATTFEECIAFFDSLPNDGVAEEFYEPTLRKAADLARSSEEYDRLLERTDGDSPLDTEIGLRKISLLTTLEECNEIFGDYDTDTEEYRAAILRAADIIRAASAEAV